MTHDDDTRERFERLFRDNHTMVRAFVRRRVPADAVDDVVSETFLVAWRRLDRVPEAPLPWLLGIARNVVGTEARGRTRRYRLWLKAQSECVEGRESSGVETSVGPVITALAGLRERDREALTLVAWDELSPAEAADVLGEPRTRFRVRLHRAGKRLRAALAAAPSPAGRDPSAGLPPDHASSSSHAAAKSADLTDPTSKGATA